MRTASGVGYTKDAAIAALKKPRGKAVPESTFYRWLDHLCISPKWLYSQDDMKRLTQVAIHFRLGGTLKELQQSLIEEKKGNA